MKAQSKCSKMVWAQRMELIWLHDGGGYPGGRVDGELHNGLFVMVDAQYLHQQGGES